MTDSPLALDSLMPANVAGLKEHVDPKVARPCCAWAGPWRGTAGRQGFLGELDARLITLDPHAAQGDMPPFGSALSAEQLQDVTGYVLQGAAQNPP